MEKTRSAHMANFVKYAKAGSYIQTFFCKDGGEQFIDYKKNFIGKDVSFDGVSPDLVVIEPNAVITSGTKILTHFINPKTGVYDFAVVRIKRNAFIGLNTIITKPVTIGENAVVGAGSIITKDVPDNEVWAGNPTRFIRKVETKVQNE